MDKPEISLVSLICNVVFAVLCLCLFVICFTVNSTYIHVYFQMSATDSDPDSYCILYASLQYVFLF
jgi:hypothetical protein